MKNRILAECALDIGHSGAARQYHLRFDAVTRTSWCGGTMQRTRRSVAYDRQQAAAFAFLLIERVCGAEMDIVTREMAAKRKQAA